MNDGSAAATATVRVTVEHVNHAPIANAGPDQSRVEGSGVTLNGAASSDPDGDTLSYFWRQTAGPAVALSAQSATPTFTAPEVGPGGAAVVLTLTVNDGFVESSPDQVVVCGTTGRKR